MPKRPNPFGDPFATQFKTHVSQKVVDMGVNKETNMKAVYEKTLALLYGGQRDLAQANRHAVNGHGMNGHEINGHGMNGHEMNGHGMNGHGMNGHGMNGHEMNGHGMNGHGMNGQGMNGHGVNGHGMNGHCGHVANGHDPANDHMMNGVTQTNGQSNGLQHLMACSQQHLTNGHSHDGASNADMDVDAMATDGPELVSGQSFLDSNCRLVHSLPNSGVQSRNLPGAASTCSHNNNIQTPPICQMCRRSSRPAKSQCNFCEKLLCADCIRQCDNCEDRFCTLCSTVNYDERDERVFCLSCAA